MFGAKYKEKWSSVLGDYKIPEKEVNALELGYKLEKEDDFGREYVFEDKDTKKVVLYDFDGNLIDLVSVEEKNGDGGRTIIRPRFYGDKEIEGRKWEKRLEKLKELGKSISEISYEANIQKERKEIQKESFDIYEEKIREKIKMYNLSININRYAWFLFNIMGDYEKAGLFYNIYAEREGKNLNRKGAFMKIKWYGHAAFLITSENGVKIITDPYEAGAFGTLKYGPIVGNFDIAIVSHDHADHTCKEVLSRCKTRVSKAGRSNVDGIKIESFETFHDEAKGSKRGKKNRKRCGGKPFTATRRRLIGSHCVRSKMSVNPRSTRKINQHFHISSLHFVSTHLMRNDD